jgi:hypothetical protein
MHDSHNQCHQIAQKERKDINFVLPFSLGNTARHHPQGLHPSAIKLNTPGEIGKSPREYTHTHMGVHDDFIKETG